MAKTKTPEREWWRVGQGPEWGVMVPQASSSFLYPDFHLLVKRWLAQVTAQRWSYEETHRSVERQASLNPAEPAGRWRCGLRATVSVEPSEDLDLWAEAEKLGLVLEFVASGRRIGTLDVTLTSPAGQWDQAALAWYRTGAGGVVPRCPSPAKPAAVPAALGAVRIEEGDGPVVVPDTVCLRGLGTSWWLESRVVFQWLEWRRQEGRSVDHTGADVGKVQFSGAHPDRAGSAGDYLSTQSPAFRRAVGWMKFDGDSGGVLLWRKGTDAGPSDEQPEERMAKKVAVLKGKARLAIDRGAAG